jgi:hypothetical protein
MTTAALRAGVERLVLFIFMKLERNQINEAGRCLPDFMAKCASELKRSIVAPSRGLASGAAARKVEAGFRRVDVRKKNHDIGSDSDIGPHAMAERIVISASIRPRWDQGLDWPRTARRFRPCQDRGDIPFPDGHAAIEQSEAAIHRIGGPHPLPFGGAAQRICGPT